jgi:nicotinamide-nucleotide amidase
MFEEGVIPFLKQKIEGVYEILDMKFFGIGESQLAHELKGILREEEHFSVAPYIGENEVIVRIRTFERNKELAKEKIEKIQKQILERLEDYLIGYNEERLEEQIVNRLKVLGYTIATAESCTGGMLSSTLVNCAGVSSVFKEGIVTYSNEAKEHYLGVNKNTLGKYGAVSEETAREMAIGIRRVTKADVGIGITGIAGPDGGSEEKPVGLVYIGMATPQKVKVYKKILQGDRKAIREKTVKNALYELYKELK